MSAPTPATGDGSPEAGYYPDPSIPGYIRYWNGAAWVPGTSRPAPAEGEAMPVPPASAAPARLPAQAGPPAAPVPVVEETGPVFLDEEPGIASESGPAAEPEPAAERGAAPEPASAWQADMSRQRGQGGAPGVAWGAAGRPDPRVPAAAADPTGGALPGVRRVEPEPGTRTGPDGPPAHGPGAQGSDAHVPGAQGPDAHVGSAHVPGTHGPGAHGRDAHGAAAQPQGPQTLGPGAQPQAPQAQGPQPHAVPHSPVPSQAAAPQPVAAHQAPAPHQVPAQAVPDAPVTSGPGGGAASWAQQVHQLAQPAPAAAPAGAALGADAAQPVVPWKPPVSDPFLRAAQERAAARPAGLGRRFAARLIDTLVLGALAGAAAAPFVRDAVDHIIGKIDEAKRSGETVTVWFVDGTTSVQFGIALGILLVLGVLYEALPTAKWGRTLGKQLCGTEVRGIESHEPPGFGAALRRWLVYGVLGLAAVGVLNVLWCLFDRPWRQCWHDKAAGTFVAAR
ncbi:RDD family protein [Streptomyces sp. SudanB25_2051]|uniref:RDD family protein n=1 Tax=Streptomyces sp. SudanB25_2051 TaxID=3035275 RepID=UPI003F54AD05